MSVVVCLFVCCSIWFIGKYIPETKGLTLEEVEQLFASRQGQVVPIATHQDGDAVPSGPSSNEP